MRFSQDDNVSFYSWGNTCHTVCDGIINKPNVTQDLIFITRHSPSCVTSTKAPVYMLVPGIARQQREVDSVEKRTLAYVILFIIINYNFICDFTPTNERKQEQQQQYSVIKLTFGTLVQSVDCRMGWPGFTWFSNRVTFVRASGMCKFFDGNNDDALAVLQKVILCRLKRKLDPKMANNVA